jgi:CheY-like chemotaxis protein
VRQDQVGETALPFQGLRVLYLEDEVIVAMYFAELLESLGCIVVECHHLSEAFAALLRERPDVALLDLNIHGESSFGVADQLVRLGVPIGFLTGYATETIEEPWCHYPTCEKPCGAGDLSALISTCLLNKDGSAGLRPP